MTRDRAANPLEDTTRMAPPAAGPEGEGGPNDAYLVVLAGSGTGEMHKIDKDRYVIGRGEKVDLRFLDDGISREHALIIREAGGPGRPVRIVLEDLGSTNGTYCNGDRVQRQALAEGDKILLGSTTILRFSYHDRLEEAFQRQMTESALRDGLTHAYNKRYFTERLDSEVQYAIRHAAPLALIFLDIDHFKRINDVHGHQAGDQVLVQLATLVSSMLGEDQSLARYGGEEFAVLARGTHVQAAAALSERLRASIEAHPFVYGGTRIPVTVSVGVAAIPHPSTPGPAELVSRADGAMYEGKRAGRNRVCIAD